MRFAATADPFAAGSNGLLRQPNPLHGLRPM